MSSHLTAGCIWCYEPADPYILENKSALYKLLVLTKDQLYTTLVGDVKQVFLSLKLPVHSAVWKQLL